MLVRPAMEKDGKYVHALMEKLEETRLPFQPFLSQYLANLLDPRTAYLVVEYEGQVLAFGSLSLHYPLHHTSPVAEIVELIVDENCRGQNIGGLLLDSLIGIAREWRCCCVDVDSNRRREKAHHFYEKNGFTLSHVKLTMEL